MLTAGLRPALAEIANQQSQQSTGSSPSEAENPSENNIQEDPSPPVPQNHYEVTITATRTPTAQREIGQSTTVITSQEIEAQGARDILQVLETIPGFNVVRVGSFGGTASIIVRGGETDFNLILIDGIQVNQAGGSFDFADLTTTNIERIEVVRGPSSVLYGADAVTSVINIITRRGEGKTSGNFRFEGGSFDSYLFRGGVQGSRGRFHYAVGAHHSESDGFYKLNNQYDKTEVSASTTFELNHSSSISAYMRHSDSEYNFPTDGSGAVIDPNDFRRTNETLFSTSYENLVSSLYRTKFQYGYFRTLSKNFTIEDQVVDFFDSVFEIQQNRNYLDWQNNFQVSDNNLLTAGLSYKREQAQIADLARRSVGIFVQEQLSWVDRLFVTAGIRYDNNDRFKSFATANASAAYLINDELKIRTSVGNGFRAPDFTEIIGFPEFAIVGNEALVPEKNIATDFGVDYFSKNGRGGFSTTAFFNRFSDLIEFTFLVPPDSPNYLNIERAKSQGLELSCFIRATDDIRLSAHYTITDTEVTDAGTTPGGSFVQGEQLLRRPRHLAGFYGEFIRKRYKLRTDLKYKGRRDDVQFFSDFSSSRVILPSYWKVDFGVTIPLLHYSDSPGDVAIVLRGENIFNQSYTEIAGFASPGRSLFGGLEVTF